MSGNRWRPIRYGLVDGDGDGFLLVGWGRGGVRVMGDDDECGLGMAMRMIVIIRRGKRQ